MNTRGLNLERAATITVAMAAVVMAAVSLARASGLIGAPSAQAVLGKPEKVSDWSGLLASSRARSDVETTVKIVEFFDLQCPACRYFHTKVLPAVMSKYPGKISVSFIHFPLPTHSYAYDAARAVECGAQTAPFATIVDSVYAQQGDLGHRAWWTYVQSAGATDSSAFEACFASKASAIPIDSGLALASALNVHSTPTLVINGWKFSSVPSAKDFDEIMSRVLIGEAPVKKGLFSMF